MVSPVDRLERRLGWALGVALVAWDRTGPTIVALVLALAWLAALSTLVLLTLVFPGALLVATGWLLWGMAALGDRLGR